MATTMLFCIRLLMTFPMRILRRARGAAADVVSVVISASSSHSWKFRVRAKGSSSARSPCGRPRSTRVSRADPEPFGIAGLPDLALLLGSASSTRHRTADAVHVPSSGPRSSFVVNAGYKLRLDPELVCSQSHGFRSDLTRDAAQLKQHAAGFHDSDPVLRNAFSRSHARFRRLLRSRFVRKDPDPDFAFALHHSCQRYARRFDLALRNPSRFHGFQTEIAEGDRCTPRCLAAPPASLGFAKFDPLWHQHVFTNSLYLLLQSAKDLSLADPHFHADGSVDRVRRRIRIVDVRTKRLGRYATVFVL